MTNHNCFRTWMTGPWTWMMAQMGHWTGHFDAGPSASFLTTNYECFRNRMMGHWTWSFQVAPSVSRVMNNYDRFRTWMLGHWTCRFEAEPWPSFILNVKLWLFPDLDDGPDGTLDLSFWRRSFSFIHNDKLWLFPDLDDGALDLSSWSWAFGPASFPMTDYDCVRAWMMGHGTWSFEANP